jgi:hypothetical protein
MAGANKTTMAKLNRERKLRERRMEKKARKDARKHGSAGQPGQSGDVLSGDADPAVPSFTEYDPSLSVESPSDDASAKIRAEVGAGAQQSTLPAGGSAAGGEPEADPNERGEPEAAPNEPGT